jgi:MurNAc alpha-1-phosphate uridylyltransferase
MVLAAGLGSRLRPITDVTPKPLVEVAGRSLLDRGLDQLERAGVRRAVVNVHHLGGQIITHCAKRPSPELIVSDERAGLLDSGGGVVKALPHLGAAPFLILNADTFWHDPHGRVLDAMIAAWDGRRMDMLLLLVHQADAVGHSGGGDFLLAPGNRLARAKGDAKADAPVYAGVIIAKPSVFAGAPEGPHSLNLQFDRLIARGRLFGHLMDAPWITVGTPQGLADAEAAMRRFGNERPHPKG